MDSETRQKRIEELKALRAELMAYKEASEGESGEGEGTASNTDMMSLRKGYFDDYQDEHRTDGSKYEDMKKELYSQQDKSEGENVEPKQLTLSRRR